MMSREIKFRAWDNGDACMVIGSTRRFIVISSAEGVESRASDEGYELMQYTGLKDKNGVEIYEGDVIKTVALANDHHQRGATEALTVREFAGNFCLCFQKHEGGIPIFPFNVTHTLEVIGNIHENPELMGAV